MYIIIIIINHILDRKTILGQEPSQEKPQYEIKEVVLNVENIHNHLALTSVIANNEQNSILLSSESTPIPVEPQNENVSLDTSVLIGEDLDSSVIIRSEGTSKTISVSTTHIEDSLREKNRYYNFYDEYDEDDECISRDCDYLYYTHNYSKEDQTSPQESIGMNAFFHSDA